MELIQPTNRPLTTSYCAQHSCRVFQLLTVSCSVIEEVIGQLGGPDLWLNILQEHLVLPALLATAHTFLSVSSWWTVWFFNSSFSTVRRLDGFIRCFRRNVLRTLFFSILQFSINRVLEMTIDATKNAGKCAMSNILSVRNLWYTKDSVFWLAQMKLFVLT